MSAHAIVAKISHPHGEPLTTAIRIHAHGYPSGVGRMLFRHYDNEADIDRLLALGNRHNLPDTPDATCDHPQPTQPTYAQPGGVAELLDSEWLQAAHPKWLYVRYHEHWLAAAVRPHQMLRPPEDVIYPKR